MSEYAIDVRNITKLYKLYDKPSDRLKESLGLSKKKKYREHYALYNMNFSVKKGECVGIIGTNGAGKSTILKIITGVLNPTSGEVVINGRISALLELGAGFNSEYSGLENVYLNGSMIGFSRKEIDEKLDDILAFADIGDFIYQPVKTYSSGMFVRLAFAVAINIDPEILIVDEALSVGDVFFQAKCFHKFEEFKQRGKTIVFVSHDLGSIEKYCDRVILLNKGHKLDEGTPKDMINIYKKLIVNQYTDPVDNNHGTDDVSQEDNVENLHQDISASSKDSVHDKGHSESKDLWKSNYTINPNVDAYGNGDAEIIDFAIVDEHGTLTNNIEKGTDFIIKSKVQFHKDIQDPIFTYTFKNVQGTAITGTNTMYEKVSVGVAKKGDIYVACFKQKMNLQGGEYLLSISCTGFRDGEFVVYNRLYDVVNITVLSEQNTVGFYDMFSDVTVEKVEL